MRLKPLELVCDLQQVDLQDIPNKPPNVNKDNFFSLFNFKSANITEGELEQLKSLLFDYKDVFSISEFDIGHISTVRHKIR